MIWEIASLSQGSKPDLSAATMVLTRPSSLRTRALTRLTSMPRKSKPQRAQ